MPRKEKITYSKALRKRKELKLNAKDNLVAPRTGDIKVYLADPSDKKFQEFSNKADFGGKIFGVSYGFDGSHTIHFYD